MVPAGERIRESAIAVNDSSQLSAGRRRLATPSEPLSFAGGQSVRSSRWKAGTAVSLPPTVCHPTILATTRRAPIPGSRPLPSLLPRWPLLFRVPWWPLTDAWRRGLDFSLPLHHRFCRRGDRVNPPNESQPPALATWVRRSLIRLAVDLLGAMAGACANGDKNLSSPHE